MTKRKTETLKTRQETIELLNNHSHPKYLRNGGPIKFHQDFKTESNHIINIIIMNLFKNSNIRQIFFSLLLIFSFSTINLPSYAQLTTGIIIGEAIEAVDDLVQGAFDRLDLTALKTAMEIRALIEEVEFSTKDVVSHSVDELDGQQKRMINDLQNLVRLVSKDIERALLEIREEKNSAISDLRLLLSNKPGAIRIIPGYAMSQDQYIDFDIIGTALSKATFENTRFNTASIYFDIKNQTDTKMTIRVPLNKALVTELLKRSNGKPAEAIISFDIIERSWFDLFETDRRRFNATGYILPKILGTARAVFSCDLETKESKNVTESPFHVVTKEAILTWFSGRKRGVKEDGITFNPDRGWKIDTRTAKLKFKKSEGCSNKQSYATFSAKRSNGLTLKVKAVSDLGKGSVCKTSTILSYTQRRNKEEKNRIIKTDVKKIYTNSDITFNLPTKKVVKRFGLLHIEISSPFFGNGTKILYPNSRLGILKLDYQPTTQTGILRIDL